MEKINIFKNNKFISPVMYNHFYVIIRLEDYRIVLKLCIPIFILDVVKCVINTFLVSI